MIVFLISSNFSCECQKHVSEFIFSLFSFVCPIVLLSGVGLLSFEVTPRVGSEEMFILGTHKSCWSLHLPRTLLDSKRWLRQDGSSR